MDRKASCGVRNMKVNEKKATKIITLIAILVFTVILGVTGYMFLGHKDSKFQEWLAQFEQYQKEQEQKENNEAYLDAEIEFILGDRV